MVSLFAQAAAKKVVFDSELVLLLGALAFLIVIGLIAVIELRKRRREVTPGPGVPSLTLSDLESLRDQGTITPDEFARLCAALEGRGASSTAIQPGPPPTAP